MAGHLSFIFTALTALCSKMNLKELPGSSWLLAPSSAGALIAQHCLWPASLIGSDALVFSRRWSGRRALKVSRAICFRRARGPCKNIRVSFHHSLLAQVHNGKWSGAGISAQTTQAELQLASSSDSECPLSLPDKAATVRLL